MKSVLKKFRVGEENYIFSANSGILVKADELAERVVDALNRDLDPHSHLQIDGFCDEDISSAIRAVEESGFFDMHPSLISRTLSRRLSKIVLMIAHDCNLACDYCFGDEGTYHSRGYMNKECAYRAIDFLVQNAASRTLKVSFFGGEPLLRFNLIKQVVEYCKAIASNNNFEFSFSITTNGTLITKEVEDFFISEKFYVQVSIDGNEAMHDRNRHYKDQSGSYYKILESTDTLRRKTEVKGKATVSMDNIDMVTVFDHIDYLGFSQIPITLAHSAIEPSDYERVNYETSRFVRHLYSLIKEGKFDLVRKASRTYKILKMIHKRQYKRSYCGAGIGMLTIDINGNIYPCHRLSADDKKSSIGSIYNQKDLKNNVDIFQKGEKCNLCWIQGLCAGGCPSTNYSISKRYSCCPEYICEHERQYVGELFNLYILLNQSEKDKLFSA